MCPFTRHGGRGGGAGQQGGQGPAFLEAITMEAITVEAGGDLGPQPETGGATDLQVQTSTEGQTPSL